METFLIYRNSQLIFCYSATQIEFLWPLCCMKYDYTVLLFTGQMFEFYLASEFSNAEMHVLKMVQNLWICIQREWVVRKDQYNLF